mmetsp:Transcript_18555/g.42353  ORF Transcript_18555/g.42353 Transcript_18555/m.42353 type:complete len:272 (-) Transcript_18555:1265-2080(-)
MSVHTLQDFNSSHPETPSKSRQLPFTHSDLQRLGFLRGRRICNLLFLRRGSMCRDAHWRLRDRVFVLIEIVQGTCKCLGKLFFLEVAKKGRASFPSLTLHNAILNVTNVMVDAIGQAKLLDFHEVQKVFDEDQKLKLADVHFLKDEREVERRREVEEGDDLAREGHDTFEQRFLMEHHRQRAEFLALLLSHADGSQDLPAHPCRKIPLLLLHSKLVHEHRKRLPDLLACWWGARLQEAGQSRVRLHSLPHEEAREPNMVLLCLADWSRRRV